MITKSQKLLYYLIRHNNGVEDKTKLAKLEYFADFIHFAFKNTTISDQPVYTKQKQGPLSRSLDIDLETLKNGGFIKESPKYHYKVVKDLPENLNPVEKITVNYVLKRYGAFAYSDLINICHSQAPYLSTQDGGIVELFTAYNLVDEYTDYPTTN